MKYCLCSLLVSFILVLSLPKYLSAISGFSKRSSVVVIQSSEAPPQVVYVTPTPHSPIPENNSTFNPSFFGIFFVSGLGAFLGTLLALRLFFRGRKLASSEDLTADHRQLGESEA